MEVIDPVRLAKIRIFIDSARIRMMMLEVKLDKRVIVLYILRFDQSKMRQNFIVLRFFSFQFHHFHLRRIC